MAQSYLNLETTDAGLALIARSLYGDSVTFTKIRIGNGVQTASKITDMVNPLVTVGITKIDKSEGKVILTGYLTSSDIESSFYGTEMGVYAKASDEEEVLFAYRFNQAEVDYYPATSSGRAIELTFSVVVQIGAAENVTAILIEGDTYASKEDFDNHLADKDNPHGVTKEQLGLGNIENKTINNQTPTYTVPSATADLASGETLGTAFGKIAAAIKALIAHVKDRENPHGITAAAISAANVNHSHSTADINSGTLSILRGGTGGTTAETARTNLGAAAASHAHSAGDITSGTLPVARGGTGATSAATARTNLGLKNGATLTFTYNSSTKTLSITG